MLSGSSLTSFLGLIKFFVLLHVCPVRLCSHFLPLEWPQYGKFFILHSLQKLFANDSEVEYVSRRTGKLVPAHVIGSPCNDGCFGRVTEPIIRDLHKYLWEIGNYDIQNAYIQKLVSKVLVKHHRPSKNAAAFKRSFILLCLH